MTASLSLDRPAAAVRLPVARRRRVGPAALVSLGLHAALIGLAVLWARYHPPAVLVPLERPATVELVMSPPGGEPSPAEAPQPKPAPAAPKAAAAAPKIAAAAHKAAAPAPEAAAPAPKTAAAAPKAPTAAPAIAEATPPQPKPAPDTPKAAAPAPDAPPAAPATAAAAPPPPKPAPDTPKAAAVAPKAPPAAPVVAEAEAEPPAAAPPPPSPPAPASPQDELRFNSAELESDTNALVTGDLVVPPSPDVKYHNRKPSYPMTAALEGEQGAVILLIHVSPDGLVNGVDVVRSSGFSVLDRAARDAVLTWHFLPSVRDGQAVPSDVPIRFVFALD